MNSTTNKTVVVIPAGRRRYMRLLVPQILSQHGWDELYIFENCQDPEDRKWVLELNKLDPRIKIIQDTGVLAEGVHWHRSLNRFWKYCMDPDTVYIRMDDDVVYIEPGLIEKLAAQRRLMIEPYLIMPVIVNNSVTSHFMRNKDMLEQFEFPSSPFDHDNLTNMPAVDYLHTRFLKNLDRNVLYTYYHPNMAFTPPHQISINVIAYFGSDIAAWNGEVPDNTGEEMFVSYTMPIKTKRDIGYFGGAIASHYAFTNQREYMDNTDFLQQYEDILRKRGYKILPAD